MNASSNNNSKSALKSRLGQSQNSNECPTGGWTALVDDIVEGNWANPETGKPAELDYDTVVIDETLYGREAELIAGLKLGEKLAVVCDENTYDALGGRIAKAQKSLGSIDTSVLNHPHADEKNFADLKDKLSCYEGVVAVGSGTAGSMNGYTSSTASIILESGLKVSLPSHAPSGTYIDLKTCAEATGGSTTYKDLGISADFYNETIAHCKEMRNRYSVLDLVADVNLMNNFIEREV